MKTSGKGLEQQAIEVLQACLEDIPFLEIVQAEREPVLDGLRPDGLIRLRLPEGEQILLIEVKSNGQPRLARMAADQLFRYRSACPSAYAVFAAPYISPQAADFCRREGIGYVDLAGNCLLSFDGVYVQREGRPTPFAEKRDLRSLYSPKAERVLRVMLVNPRRRWKVQALAGEAGVSLGHAHNVKKFLTDREWLSITSDGFALSQPGQVLAEWAQNYQPSRNQKLTYYSMQPNNQIEAELAQVCHKREVPYALTGFSGAARLAPAVRYQRVMAYVATGVTETAADLALKEVTSGANVHLLAPYDEGVLYRARDMDGIQIATPVQVYLDLQGLRARGGEAAQFLLEQVIRPTW